MKADPFIEPTEAPLRCNQLIKGQGPINADYFTARVDLHLRLNLTYRTTIYVADLQTLVS